MNQQISGGAGRAPEESRGRLQNLVGLLQIPHFPLELFDPLLLSRRGTRALVGIDLRLQHPPAQ
jgi:hypothetical protein